MRETVYNSISGSRLYGTNIPTSDLDLKAIHLPTVDEILMQTRVDVLSKSTGPKDGKNSASDTDIESFSLQRFLSLLTGMQTIAVDILFSYNTPAVVESSSIMDTVWENRGKLLNKNPAAFVGYCRSQAVRYSNRGKRLEAFESICEMLEDCDRPTLGDYSLLLRSKARLVDSGFKIVRREMPGGNVVQYLDVYGRQAAFTLKTKEALAIYQKPMQQAGKRAMEAYEAGGADWKALYHAVRIANQGIELFRDGHITFPRPEKELLLDIRKGELPMEEVLDIFDASMVFLDEAVEKSSLPDKPDLAFVENFIKGTNLGVILSVR